ncbi:leucine-rich repeat-containing G-protein coupled receptor 4 [Culex quinquefasciatus]|uniref:leucine-rich repeat-containing G-protein coupled receptor 4 n=1 Tax=Culex quinquefasciatus TaxID=7176 RepID=UPI0018E3C804|nr:leucine-rich repeat-containing G-protein coupled receptor 4 [Culex quinquefasciatus]
MNRFVLIFTTLLALTNANEPPYCHPFEDFTTWYWPDFPVETWTVITDINAIDQITTDHQTSADQQCTTTINVLVQNISSFSAWIPDDEDRRTVDNLWIDGAEIDRFGVPLNVVALRLSNVKLNNLIVVSLEKVEFSLEKVFLKNVSLKVMPQNVGKLRSLDSLIADQIELKVLNMFELNNLKYLQKVQITNSKLISFSVGQANLPSLFVLNLSGNRIQDVPEDLAQLSNLGELDLAKNKITFLQMSVFSGLNNLQKLDLSYNPLIVGAIGVVQLPVLRDLSLQNCNLKYLDVLFWRMPELRSLNLEHNELSHVAYLENHFNEDTVLYSAGNIWSCDWLKAATKTVAFRQTGTTSSARNDQVGGVGCDKGVGLSVDPFNSELREMATLMDRKLDRIGKLFERIARAVEN